MGTITLTLPTSGTIITAGLHSTNYGSLQTVINGGLDNNNFSSGKIFDLQKLMQGAATTGALLNWDGTNWSQTQQVSLVNIAAAAVFQTKLLSGDANPAFRVGGDGKTQWGAGGASALDTDLYRSGVATLRTDGSLIVNTQIIVQGANGFFFNPSSNLNAFYSQWQGEANPRFYVESLGTMHWGVGGATAVDTNLYRNGAGYLKSDGGFQAVFGIANKTKAGAPVDADYTTVASFLQDGLLVVDTTNSKIWVRVGGTWKGVVVA